MINSQTPCSSTANEEQPKITLSKGLSDDMIIPSIYTFSNIEALFETKNLSGPSKSSLKARIVIIKSQEVWLWFLEVRKMDSAKLSIFRLVVEG